MPASIAPASTPLQARGLWLSQPQHTVDQWAGFNQRFNFRFSNLPAGEVLAVLAAELGVGYDTDECAAAPITLVGQAIGLSDLSEILAEQAGAQLRFKANRLQLRCETETLQVYELDYLAIERNMQDSAALSSAIAENQRDNVGRRETGNRSELLIANNQTHNLWGRMGSQIEQIIGAQTAPVEISTRERTVDEEQDRLMVNNRRQNRLPTAPGVRSTSLQSRELRDITTTRRERQSGKVIVNPEAATIAVLAKPSAHARVQSWLNTLQARVNRQVLLESVITEVTLNERHEQGVDWAILSKRGLIAGLEVQGLPVAGEFFRMTAQRNSASLDSRAVVRLLEEFGQTSVLSSPRVVAMNQQAALLKVVDNTVYFTTDVQTSAPTNNTPAFSVFTTQVQTVPVGFLMTVTPQISTQNEVQLRVRPTLSRIVGFVQDPNPALRQLNIVSEVPEIQTRELESILKIRDGETVLLGGLRQLSVNDNRSGLPGQAQSNNPLTSSRKNRQTNTELVVMLKATVLPAQPLAMPHSVEDGRQSELRRALQAATALLQTGQDGLLVNYLNQLAEEFPMAPEIPFNLGLLFADSDQHASLAYLAQTETLCKHLRCHIPTRLLRAMLTEPRP